MFNFKIIKNIFLQLYAAFLIIAPLCHAEPIIHSEDLLMDKVYAVHATRTLPDSDYLRAGFAIQGLTHVQKTLLPKARSTLHFALGELVRPVEGVISWENCPYAIVTALRHLVPQLINLNCYDTFILGDLKLVPDIYLIVPVNEANNIKSHATIITYNPENQSLRQATDDFIASKGGWHIQMDEEDVEDELHEAYLDGNNVNTPKFFASLKIDRPWLAIGVRFNELDGEHYRLSQIEKDLIVFAMFILQLNQEEPDYLSSSDLKFIIQDMSEHFKAWSHSLAGFTWCSESLEAFQQMERLIKQWAHFMREELRIRDYGKTLMSAPDIFLLECTKLLSQPEALSVFIDQNKEELLNYSP